MATHPFFWSWPTWAKLSFVLGGSLVIVLTVAGMVKVQKMIKIRKLTRKALVDPETADIRLRGRFSDEIPFGAKAMLEDPDVEGVWNSRASTPLQSPMLEPRRSSPSRNLFSRSRRNSSISSLPQLTLPEGASSHQAATDVVSPSSLDGTSAGPAIQISTVSSNTSWPFNASASEARDDIFPRRRSVTIRAASKQTLTVERPVYGPTESSSVDIKFKRRARVSTDPTPTTPTHERHGRTLILSGPPADSSSTERTPTTRKALDRMEAHRKFHAAESGQLQPRLCSLNGKNLGHKHSTSDHVVAEHEPTRAVSWPITSGEVLGDYNASRQIQTKVSPHVVPFRAFVEMHPLPKASAKMPPSAWTERTQDMLEEKLESYASKRRITIKNDRGEKTAKDFHISLDGKDGKDQPETASLLRPAARQIKSKFQPFPTHPFDDVDLVEGPGAVENLLRENTNEAPRPKKLQKKSRPKSRDGQQSSTHTSRHVRV